LPAEEMERQSILAEELLAQKRLSELIDLRRRNSLMFRDKMSPENYILVSTCAEDTTLNTFVNKYCFILNW
jgi:hypothetical protein